MASQPAPDDSPPVRIQLANSLKSRDGTLTKDSLITNGYVDVTAKGVRRVYKRSGLSSLMVPGTGTGFGMTSVVDANGVETLWYATAAGTFTRFNSSASMVAGWLALNDVAGYLDNGLGSTAGSLTPETLNGERCSFISDVIGPGLGYVYPNFGVAFSTTSLGATFFTSITVNSITLTAVSATYTANDGAGNSVWNWATHVGLSSGTTYLVTFVFP